MNLELTCPLDSLGFDGTTELPQGVTVEFERTVSVDGDCLPFLAVEGADSAAVVVTLRESDAFDEVRLAEQDETRSVYRLHWSDAPPDIVGEIADADGAIRSAVADGGSWRLRLRFPNHQAASRFYERHSENGGGATVHTIASGKSDGSAGKNGLTTLQRETLRSAFESGYYEVPRRISLTRLAAEQDVSDTAVSQRLRRGTSNVLKEMFVEE